MSEALLENIVAKRVVLEKELGIDLYIDRNDIVQRASCSVTHHQGERGILVGRNPREIPYVASHLFGYSGGSHQQAATMALEHAWGRFEPHSWYYYPQISIHRHKYLNSRKQTAYCSSSNLQLLDQ